MLYTSLRSTPLNVCTAQAYSNFSRRNYWLKNHFQLTFAWWSSCSGNKTKFLVVSGESVPSPFPPSVVLQTPTGQHHQQQQTPQGPPPAYPNLTPLSSHHLPLQHALLQQQLLQNPQFVQANANANANITSNHTGKYLYSYLLVWNMCLCFWIHYFEISIPNSAANFYRMSRNRIWRFQTFTS